jgi:hypothetical protein
MDRYLVCTIVERGKVGCWSDENVNLMILLDQPFDEVATNESGCPGDKDYHV